MNIFEKRLIRSKPIKLGQFQGSEVRYMSSSVMNNFFGYTLQNKIFVRTNLSKKVQKFVISHESYHLNDIHRWLGWFGAELRANISCGVRDPLGLIATVRASLNKDRLSKYLNLVTSLGRS